MGKNPKNQAAEAKSQHPYQDYVGGMGQAANFSLIIHFSSPLSQNKSQSLNSSCFISTAERVEDGSLLHLSTIWLGPARKTTVPANTGPNYLEIYEIMLPYHI